MMLFFRCVNGRELTGVESILRLKVRFEQLYYGQANNTREEESHCNKSESKKRIMEDLFFSLLLFPRFSLFLDRILALICRRARRVSPPFETRRARVRLLTNMKWRNSWGKSGETDEADIFSCFLFFLLFFQKEQGLLFVYWRVWWHRGSLGWFFEVRREAWYLSIDTMAQWFSIFLS